MATTNYNLPTISGASPVAIVDDYNALANATDAALAGAISGEKTRAMTAETELANGVSNALTTANSANVSATDAKSAAEKAQTTASTALNNAATAQTTADGAKSAAATAQTTADGAAAKVALMGVELLSTPVKATSGITLDVPGLSNYHFVAFELSSGGAYTNICTCVADITDARKDGQHTFGGCFIKSDLDGFIIAGITIHITDETIAISGSSWLWFSSLSLGKAATLAASEGAYINRIVGLH